MNVRSDLALAYHIGYEDALAKRMPDSSRAGVLNSYNCTNDCTNGERTGTCHEIEDEDTGFIVCSECGAVHDESYTAYYCWCCGRRIEQ